ncbi:hypothetical protein AAIH46_18040 [Rhizobium sp. 0TCS1.26]|uniref:hypothetical protein n=1 Tax=Rhizobium sp. 0TCS1.26 TaxID=3142623 RepID=UPI003D2B41B6
MQTETYNPVRARCIPAAMAEFARERGCGMTRADLLGAGYTAEEIDKHSADAGRLLSQADRIAA